MNRNIVKVLNQLLEDSSSNIIDHILLLEKISAAYLGGMVGLKPIASFYMNSYYEIPSISKKALYNEARFNDFQKDFVDKHIELKKLVEKVLKALKTENTTQFFVELSKDQFLDQIKGGKREFECLELSNLDLRNENLSGLIFRNCLLSVDFRYSNLIKSSFHCSNIKTTDFRYADLTNALMENVSFEGTRFKGAITNGFTFKTNHAFSIDNIGHSDFNNWIKDT